MKLYFSRFFYHKIQRRTYWKLINWLNIKLSHILFLSRLNSWNKIFRMLFFMKNVWSPMNLEMSHFFYLTAKDTQYFIIGSINLLFRYSSYSKTFHFGNHISCTFTIFITYVYYCYCHYRGYVCIPAPQRCSLWDLNMDWKTTRSFCHDKHFYCKSYV